ncbi:DinB family protein [Chitinophaga niastensis]|uniref:DinB family protein n=1 Tax=Chitinophaga niastensis TaxID=536980 RepID=A0A2P8HQ57_CHINA|nr:DinB family protein [Chitinophaga niastensis]PSL48342.1 DinB family protein [Chitinophaga niastensis]
MEKELLTEIDNTAADLLQTIASFKEEQINVVPFEGSWTAGQIAEHLSKAVSAGILYGNVEPTDRQPDEKSPAIKEMFLNFAIKMSSPDFVLPSNIEHKKEEILRHAEKTWADISTAAQTLDLSSTCKDFDMPGFGPLTRMEWIRFMMYHTQRHVHQLKNIHSMV